MNYINRFIAHFKNQNYFKFYVFTFILFALVATISGEWITTLDLKGPLVPIFVIGLPVTSFVLAQYFAYQAVKGRSLPGTKVFVISTIAYTAIFFIAVSLGLKDKVLAFMIYWIYGGWILQVFMHYRNKDKALLGDTGKDKTIAKAGSRLNPKNLLNGYLWSTPQQLKNFSASSAKTVYIDEFRYYPETRKELGLQGITKEEKESVVKFAPLDFTKTLLVLGGMGSGKTEFILSIANQRNQFRRQFFHDTKGDFTQKLWDPEKDFIFNPYDSRSVVWDLWTELEINETLAVAFFKSLMSAASKKDDFWSVRSGDIIADIALDVFDDDTIPKNQKWLAMSNAIEDWLNDANSGDGATKKSLAETVEMVKDICYLMAFQEHNGARRFTIKEWLETDTRLFLLNNPAYAEKLTPLFTGFTAVLASILLSKSDTKEDLTLMVLDEFFALKFDQVTRKNLLTQVRSKGGCLIIGAQYMPLRDKDEQQEIDSSRYAMILFQINDGETIKHVSSLFGSVEFMRTDVSISDGSTKSNGRSSHTNYANAGVLAGPVMVLGALSSGGNNSTSKNVSTSMRERKEDFLTPELLASMPQYHHLTYIPSEKIVYLGYTQQAELVVKNENFISINSRELRRFKKADYDLMPGIAAADEDPYNYWEYEEDEVAQAADEENSTQEEKENQNA